MASDSASVDRRESLARLDPSPIDSLDKELPPLPDEAWESPKSTIAPSHASTSSVGLGSSGRGPIFYLTRLQRYSSYTFTFFAGLHFTNTGLIPLVYRSVPYAEPFLVAAREIYQTPLTEPLLIGLPVVVHVVSGLTVRLLRRHQNRVRYRGDANPGFWAFVASKVSLAPESASSQAFSRIWPAFSNIAAAGYGFATLLASHVAMNRLLPLIVEGDSSNIGLAYVAHGFTRHPVSAYAAYTLLLSVGIGHMTWGMARWLDLAPPANWKKITFDKPTRRRRRRAWWVINATAVSLTVLWAAGGLVVARSGPAHGWIGNVYNAIYAYAGQ
ncbi:hypothetical protein F4777DRAFT_540426 [Nemania sp. FL0916]|nr:hypothetical protein F4777DRAFT_540426 [Nemania sp. FL0916]